MFNPSTPVTGAAVSGLTSPTYTIGSDQGPTPAAKQYAVTGLGGTQAGVTAHSLSSPFTLTMFRPANIKVLGQPGPNGQVRAFPKNVFEVLTRKGVSVLANQPVQTAFIRSSFSFPAGADSYDAVNLKAAISAHIGLIWQIAQGITDTTLTGTL